MADKLKVRGDNGCDVTVWMAGEESAPVLQGRCMIMITHDGPPGDPPDAALDREAVGLLIQHLTLMRGVMR